jgi:hypothetical protein
MFAAIATIHLCNTFHFVKREVSPIKLQLLIPLPLLSLETTILLSVSMTLMVL